jgi:hypothetical protein
MELIEAVLRKLTFDPFAEWRAQDFQKRVCWSGRTTTMLQVYRRELGN